VTPPSLAESWAVQPLLRIVGIAVVAALGVPASAGAAPPATASAPIAFPPIAFAQRTLPNGLRVVLVEDHRAPTVAIDVCYDVGGKDDPPARSGFAHLFEHLMFKGTSNTRPESWDRLTEDVGGYNNAYTAPDVTNYYEVVPSNHLERLLWAEADRMANLTVDEPNFVTERKVVIGEYDQRVLASPYGMLFELANGAYAVHPYKRGVIGSPAQLNAASLDDVRAFHTTYYRPDNAVVVLVGDLDPAQANAWVDRYFGPLRRPVAPIPRVTAVEPAQTAQRRVTYASKNAPLPAAFVAYHIPAASSADGPVLDVIEALLGRGASARLRTALIDRTGVASQIYANADVRQQPGVFDVMAIATAGHTSGDLVTALGAQIARLRDETVPSDELEKAKTQEISAVVRVLQTHDQVAQALARAVFINGDPNDLNRYPNAYLRVTPGDVQRVARRYLTVENSTVVEYETASATAPGPAK
jgi:zinc protease